MEKKVMKMYEAPVVEIVELEVSAPLLQESGTPLDPEDTPWG